MNRPFAVLALLTAVLSAACAGLIQASPPPFVYSEPQVLRYETTRQDNVSLVINLWERTYAVPGATATEVGENLNALRRAGSGHGPYSASTKWDLQISLRYADQPDGCRIANAGVELLGVMTLPALGPSQALDGDALARWTAFVANLKAHEFQHVANEVAGAERLQVALQTLPPQASCRDAGDSANALLAAAEQAIRDADARLDAETKHGALTGATFP